MNSSMNSPILIPSNESITSINITNHSEIKQTSEERILQSIQELSQLFQVMFTHSFPFLFLFFFSILLIQFD